MAAARHGELFDTEFGLYRLPEHRQMVKASDPGITRIIGSGARVDTG